MRALVLLFAALACASGGCKRTLHWRAIEDDLMVRLGHTTPLRSVECGESEVAVGARFDCLITAVDGDATTVTIELTDQVGGWRAVQ